jgi:hypothetical protein
MKRLALALAVALASVAAAQPTVLERSRDVAVAAWGVAPCGGQRIPIDWRDLPGKQAGRASWWGERPPFHRCRVTIDSGRRWTARRLCTVIVHEYGHLLGRGHSADPRDVMHSPVPRYYQPCAEAFSGGGHGSTGKANGPRRPS